MPLTAARSSIFQSTPSARRATHRRCTGQSHRDDFNPRPPRGGRLSRGTSSGLCSTLFQSTPSARRATRSAVECLCDRMRFQSTPSARRATQATSRKDLRHVISIHALREEGDDKINMRGSRTKDFNPRPPRGGRQFHNVFFLSVLRISIHALREEGDRLMRCSNMVSITFQSTPSARRATGNERAFAGYDYHFNPRPPRGGRRGGP